VSAIIAAFGMSAAAVPSVRISSVSPGRSWSTIKVDYIITGMNTNIAYKVAFDVTANGEKVCFTNSVQNKEGSCTQMINTQALFKKPVSDPEAKVGVTVIMGMTSGVQLWENGPYWSECNVGADKPADNGYYFWWGDTVGYKRNAANNGWISVKDGTAFEFVSGNCATYDKSVDTLRSEGFIDSTDNLTAKHDAATAHLGALWRMPSVSDINALVKNCDTAWTIKDGVNGRLVTGRGAYADRSIFLPATGYGGYPVGSDVVQVGDRGEYWFSTPNLTPSYSSHSCALYFYSSSFSWDVYGLRHYARTIRPVWDDTVSYAETNYVLCAELPSGAYGIHYAANGGTGSMADQNCQFGQVEKLTGCGFTNGGRNFAGWRCSNGRRYDDGVLVYELAPAGGWVVMTAIWD